ncbi:hypothetical protein SELMODRAFT_416015 [Selaginella moellendorffii]|uniref:Gnk2-homologous domain-containing protein n=1 Tax=Selaginella moellendorffii TaxID=88036 RepID=D8RXT4_SELML|nr:antifungal protein ginkbilobin-2 [Selaginella moellendorffii]EFJ22969.1 hypothetical protein SELMODRAFT_416015 [Selaginella moellendorffii]|eukprot:XP_002976064.1 antifungal protein ginkbilobin-2 [Selaginella moellendorffii]
MAIKAAILVAIMSLAMALTIAVEARGTITSKLWRAMDVDFSGYCSDESIPTGSTYWTSLNQTLTDLIQNTAYANNMTYSVKNGGDDVSAYGQAQCFNMVGNPGMCKSCVEDLVRRAWRECGDAIAGMLMLKDKCTIRYQDSPL